MPLPSADYTIHHNSLYPDAIGVVYQYALSSAYGYETLLGILNDRGFEFTRLRNRRAARTKLRCDVLDTAFEVEFARYSGRTPVRIKAHLNPLRYLHDLRADFGDEHGVNGDCNWLHLDDIRPHDNRHVWSQAYDMIVAIETTTFEMMEAIATETGGVIGLQGISLDSLEVCMDLAAPDPEAMTERLGREVRETFRNSVERSYRLSAHGYRSFEGERMMIEGYRREGERYKVYAKTNQRVRIECAISSPAISARRISRDLTSFTAFTATMAQIAESALPDFESIVSRASGAPIRFAGPIQLLFELSRRIRNPLVAQEVINILVRRGHITRDTGVQALGARLADAGLVERAGRNHYRISPRFQHALRLLGEMDKAWLDFTREEV